MRIGLFWAIKQLVVLMSPKDRRDSFFQNVGKELPLLCVTAKKSAVFFFVNACSEQMKN